MNPTGLSKGIVLMRCDRKGIGVLLPVALLALGLSGCFGPAQYDVTGQVKYNGAPLHSPGGQIVFVGSDGKQVAGAIADDGTYKASRVTGGPNRVAVYYPNPQFSKKKTLPSEGKSGKGPPPPKAARAFLTPDKYAAVDSSNLSVEVAEGTVFNVDMVGPVIRETPREQPRTK